MTFCHNRPQKGLIIPSTEWINRPLGITQFVKYIKNDEFIDLFPVPGGFLPQPPLCAAVHDLHLCPPTAAPTAPLLQNQEGRARQRKCMFPANRRTDFILIKAGRQRCRFP